MSCSFPYPILIVFSEYEHQVSEGIDESQAHDQRVSHEEKFRQSEKLEDVRIPGHDSNGCGVEEEPEVSVLTLSAARSKDENKNEEVTNVSHIVPTELHTAGEKAIPAEEHYFAASDGASHTEEPCKIVPEEEPARQDFFPVRETVFNESPMEMEETAPEETLKAPEVKLVIEDSENTVKHNLGRDDIISHHLSDPCDSSSMFDVTPMHDAPAEHTEFLGPPQMPALSAVQDELDFHSPPSAEISSTVTSLLGATVPEAPRESSHTVTLEILNGGEVLRCIAFIETCTRTAILKEARAYCVRCAQDNQRLGTLLANGYDLALISLELYGYDMDLSTYKLENLSCLVRTIEKKGIPRFTVQISEV